jgi:hypothetical protein
LDRASSARTSSRSAIIAATLAHGEDPVVQEIEPKLWQ